MTYRVVLAADASVGTVVTVEADSAKQAEQLAIERAKAGDVIWRYEGTDDSNIEAVEVTKQ